MLIGPTIRRRRLGSDLRRLREAKSLKLEDVAGHLGIASSTLSRIETGKAPTKTGYLALMLDLYEVADPARRSVLVDLARESQRKGWWAECNELLPAGTGRYLGLEAEASALRAFQAQAVHDLLRTPDYARAVITASRPDLTAAQIERLVSVQLRRQEALRGSDPIHLRLILDEAVLQRSMGPPNVMRAQLEHLVEASDQPTVTLQVLKLASAERHVLAGSFAIVSFAEPGDSAVVCAEGVHGQVLLDERDAQVQAMRLVFDALSLSALPPAKSAELIGDLARTL